MDGSKLTYSGNSLPTDIVCPNCKASLTNKTGLQAIIITCKACKSIYDTRKKKVLGKYTRMSASAIPLGTKGKLKSVTYEVVGFIKFRELKTVHTWSEYTLFSPTHGYAYLSEYKGHWSFVEHTIIHPLETRSSFNFRNKNYIQYNQYKSSIDFAAGEFNWDLMECTQKKITEYLAPPTMLIKEVTPSDLTWYNSEHIDADELCDVFHLKKSSLPQKIGVGPLTPLTVSMQYNAAMIFTGVFLVLLFLVQLLLTSTSQNKLVLEKKFYITQDTIPTIVSPSFKLESLFTGKDNLEIEIYANVYNSWFETTMTLVNDDTGEEFYIENGVEYYTGVEDGYGWSEGSTTSSEVLSQIPDGTYHLNIVPHLDPAAFNNQISSFNIKLTRGVGNWSNFFWLLFGSIFYPGFLYFRNDYMESQRWL